VAGDDTDAQAYITAVETADGQSLETGVRDAINAFVVGCKADGIWTAIKASCILAGARTLSGALVPLVGTAPTNNNFVSGDYNRETGLAGDGSTKYLDSNRASNADPQNSHHLAIYNSNTFETNEKVFIGAYSSNTKNGALFFSSGSFYFNNRISSGGNQSATSSTAAGFAGSDRSSSTLTTARRNSNNYTDTTVSTAPSASGDYFIFALNNSGSATNHSAARIAFYSIGESLNLSLLDSRVSTLLTAYAAAIP